MLKSATFSVAAAIFVVADVGIALKRAVMRFERGAIFRHGNGV